VRFGAVTRVLRRVVLKNRGVGTVTLKATTTAPAGSWTGRLRFRIIEAYFK